MMGEQPEGADVVCATLLADALEGLLERQQRAYASDGRVAVRGQ